MDPHIFRPSHDKVNDRTTSEHGTFAACHSDLVRLPGKEVLDKHAEVAG